jgi:hypothetical protein
VSNLLEVTVHEIATDGLPDMAALVGRVAFIFDGCIVSGWPLVDPEEGLDERDDEGRAMWEANSDVGRVVKFANVTHWVEFPVPVWEIERKPAEVSR